MTVNKAVKCIFIMLFAVSFSFAQTTENDAQREISLKNFRQAREIYKKLAVEQPDKLPYKIWVARLSSWLLELPKALKEYDEILRENLTNNEALLGKVYVLMWQKKYGKAEKILAVAEKNGCCDAAFLVTKINFFRYQNKLKEARKLVETAKKSDSENVEIKELEQKLEESKSNTYQFGCEQNFEPFTASTTSCFASVKTEKGNDQISAKMQTGRRFGKNYRELAVNWKRDVNSNLTILGNISLEPKKSVNIDANIGFNYKVSERMNAGIDYRRWRLNGKNINIFSSNASFKINEKTNVQTTLYNSSNNVLLIRFNRQITKPLSVGLNIVKAFENLKLNGQNLSQNAFVASGKYQISKNLTISGSCGYTKKEGKPSKQIYGFGFTFTK